MATAKFEWDHPKNGEPGCNPHPTQLTTVDDAYAACDGAHAVAIITEWDEFKSIDWQKAYDSMVKPAFLFDGRNILDHTKLREIGFIVYGLGKPLDPFVEEH
eukprot:jgi/Tetstr1/420637/TSEL_011725.t1